MSGGGPPVDGPGAVVELWRQPDGLWRWRYLEPADDSRPRAFLSNKEYETRELALRSATTAYPGVAVFQPASEPVPATRPASRLRVLVVLAAVAMLVLWSRRRNREAAGA